MYVLLDTRASSARIVLLATKETQPDWDLLAPVFHVTAKGEGPAIQTLVSEMNTRARGLGAARSLGSPVGELGSCRKGCAWTPLGDGRGLGKPAAVGEDGHGAPQGCGKGARLQEMAVHVQGWWGGGVVLSCENCMGRSKAVSGPG